VIKKDNDLWNLYTRKEEYCQKKVDSEDRFCYSFSKQKNPFDPNVSFYLKELGFKSNYPDDKNFSVLFTHDVDHIYLSKNQFFRSILPHPLCKDTLGFLRVAKERLTNKNINYINFRKIIQLEKKYDVQSSFYFFSSCEDSIEMNYQIEDIKNEIFYILDEGFEIGLHTSYHAYNNLEMIKNEKKKLEEITQKNIIGVRNHMLRFKIPTSWELLSKSGFKYDTSLGYHDMVGFRNGSCHPFLPYDRINGNTINIIEIPLCLIDVTLLFYMKKNAKQSWEIIKKIIDNVEECNGVLTILWHNWTFSYPVSYAGLFSREWTRLYEKLLSYCKMKNAWMPTCEKFYEHIIKQGIFKI